MRTALAFRPPTKPNGKVLPFCLLAAALAAFLFLDTAWAQGEPDYGYVDLLMLHEQSPGTGDDSTRVAYSVRNIGTATATGVTVEFLLEDLEAGTFAGSYVEGLLTVPTITDKRTDNSTNQRFTWVVGDIPGGAPRPH